MAQVTLAKVGWWWMIAISVPFALYSIPFLLGSFDVYKNLTMAAAAGRHDIAGLNIAKHITVWQVHVAAGLAFLMVSPFQFSSSFRARYLQLHRQMGYVFVAASLVLASTGTTVMTFNSEFQQLGRMFMAVGGCLQFWAVVMALTAAKQKRISDHRCWMIRAAVMGYVVINARIAMLVLHTVFHVSIISTADYSMAISWTLNVACAELYIQKYLKGVALSKDHKS